MQDAGVTTIVASSERQHDDFDNTIEIVGMPSVRPYSKHSDV